jgi:hypothetical protein
MSTSTYLDNRYTSAKRFGIVLEQWFKTLIIFISGFTVLYPALGQNPAFNLDQMANGKVTQPFPVSQPPSSQWNWQNGNLNRNNAHFRESHSVPYRCDLTGLTPGAVYTLRIGIDVRFGGTFALDYFTSVQNLTPHGLFGHAAEKADPTVGITFATTPTINDYPLPVPVYKNTPVSGQPGTSFQALTTDNITGQPDKKSLRIYNATVANPATDIIYENGGVNGTIDLQATTAEAILSVKFTATTNHVLMAWGGHIASEFDWVGQPTPQDLTGSPYHCRIKNMLDANGNVVAKGSTDRSLKTDAVFRPPVCGLTSAQTVCQGAASPLTYSYTGGSTDVTNYKWTLSSNTAGVKISGDADNDGIVSGASLNSINIIPTSGTTFNTTGSFTLTLEVTSAGGTESCSSGGTINPAATANAGDDQTICEGSTVTLAGSVGGGATSGTWTTGGDGTFDDATKLNAVYTPGTQDKANGTVTLTLTTNDPTGPCAAVTNDMVITITDNPVRPTVEYLAPDCDETTFSVKIPSPTNGTYILTQETGGVGPVSKTYPDDKETDGSILFTGLTIGKGFSITLTIGDCISEATDCDNYKTSVNQIVTQQESVNSIQSVETVNARIEASKTKVLAAPNPFYSKIKFSLESEVSGQGSLEIYNILGQKVKTVYQGYFQKGQVQTIEYNVPQAHRSNLIYIFKVGEQRVTGKLIGLR